MLHANSINRNDGLFTAGVRSQEILRSADSAAFIKTLVDFHPRIRPSADSASEFKRLALEYLDRWKFCCDLWDSLEYLTEELDFVQRQNLRSKFFETLTAKPVQSHAELKTIAGNFVNGWLRTHSKQPENIAQSCIRDKWDN